MTITDKQRTEVHNCLRDLMGQEMADIMMELLPPVGWGEVVRRQDVNGLGVALRAELSETRSDLRREIQAVRHELKSDVQAVRNELQEVRSELRAEIQEVRGELKSDIQTVRSELRTEIQTVHGELKTFQEVTERQFGALGGRIDDLKSAITTLIVCNVAMFGVVLTLLWQGR